jgi:hypothetical protein
MVGLLVLGLLLTRVIGHDKPRVSEARAVAIARTKVDFATDGHNIRLVRRGIPPRAFWIVSFWSRNRTGGYKRITLVLIDATSGRIAEVRHTT